MASSQNVQADPLADNDAPQFNLGDGPSVEDVEKNAKKTFNLLKLIDLFKSPVKLTLNRQDKITKKKMHTDKLGSVYGGILSVSAITLLILYL